MGPNDAGPGLRQGGGQEVLQGDGHGYQEAEGENRRRLGRGSRCVPQRDPRHDEVDHFKINCLTGDFLLQRHPWSSAPVHQFDDERRGKKPKATEKARGRQADGQVYGGTEIFSLTAKKLFVISGLQG